MDFFHLSVVVLGLGVWMSATAITLMAGGCGRMRSLTRENISLREENAVFRSREELIWREYLKVCRQNHTHTVNATRTAPAVADLEISALRYQVQATHRLQEQLRAKVRALAQDPVSREGNPSTSTIREGNPSTSTIREGNPSTSTISGNEIEIEQVEPLRITISSPYEPSIFPDLEFWVLLLLAAIAILIFFFSRRLISERVWLIWLWLSPPSRLNAFRNSRKMGHFVIKRITEELKICVSWILICFSSIRLTLYLFPEELIPLLAKPLLYLDLFSIRI